MSGRFILCCLVLFLTLTGSLAAQPGPFVGPPDVQIQLMPQEQGIARNLVVGPRGVGVCKNEKICGNYLTFSWIGQRNDTEKIRVVFTDEGAANCLDKTNFTIDGVGAGNRVQVNVKADDENCPEKAVHFYEVSCEGGAEGNCGGVAPVDPAVIIERGGNR